MIIIEVARQPQENEQYSKNAKGIMIKNGIKPIMGGKIKIAGPLG